MHDTYWHFEASTAFLSMAGAPSPASRSQRTTLPIEFRALFTRLTGSGAPSPQGSEDAINSQNVKLACSFDPSLRATAQAAFRSVDGSADRALDMALAVMEAEITRLRTAVEEYGEALKTIEVYGADAAARRVAASARRAAPCALRAPAPVPRFTRSRDA